MADRKNTDPSPFKAGLLHGLFSVAVFGGVGALAAGAIHFAGDPDAAGPSYVVSLFENEGVDTAALRKRRTDGGREQLASLTNSGLDSSGAAAIEPSLGVADPVSPNYVEVDTAPGPVPETITVSAPDTPRGIRINGRLVSPGQSLSQIEPIGQSEAQLAVLDKPENVVETAPNLSQLTNTRPFKNPQAKPIISLIVGGLGTSHRQTISAIDELPADVTLSFIAGASEQLLRYARKKGHEVLIEVPMEPSVQGRARAHRDTLLANVDGEQNILRLKSILRGRSQAFGIITSQGDKFASNDAAGAPILAYAKANNLAFFQHSSLQRANFDQIAAEKGTVFAKAQTNIDTEQRTSAINEQLFMLETAALEEGAALATGFAFPVTVDTIARWSYELRAKGILLAPASAYAATIDSSAHFQTEQPDLEVASLADAPSP